MLLCRSENYGQATPSDMAMQGDKGELHSENGQATPSDMAKATEATQFSKHDRISKQYDAPNPEPTNLPKASIFALHFLNFRRYSYAKSCVLWTLKRAIKFRY